MLVQGMMKPLQSQRLTAIQVLLSPPIIDTKGLAFDVQLWLTGQETITARQAIAERTANLGQIGQFARDKINAENEAKRYVDRMTCSDEQMVKARNDRKLAREE